jgi:hypothetical protein
MSFAVNSQDHLYAGTFEGTVVRSTDNGNTWQDISSGLEGPYISALTVNMEARVFAGTIFGGVYINTESTLDENANNTLLPSQIAIEKNYPNPFNASTIIEFYLPSEGFVRFEVYDVLGAKVRELAAKPFSSGRHSMIWDGCDENGRAVSSGVYISRLTLGKSAAYGRMTVLK